MTKSLYQFSMQSPDKEELYEASANLRHEIDEAAGLAGRHQRPADHQPQVNVEIDRDKAAALQVNAQQIENALYDAYGPRWVSTIYAADQRVQGAAGTEAAVPGAIRARFRCCTSRPAAASLIPLDTLATGDARSRSADHQPFRPASRPSRFRST